MYTHFETLPPAKQQRVLDAAYRAFARHGYQKTAVEEIAHGAGIAKGMVFHYFGSKRGLYEYLFTDASRFITRHFDQLEARVAPLDFIEQFRLVTKIKLQAYTENPAVFEFMSTAFFHPENLAVSPAVRAVYEDTMAFRNTALALMKASDGPAPFRPDVDPARAKRYITWVIDGYTQSLISQFSGRTLAEIDTAPYWQEIDDILDDLKRLFYRPEPTTHSPT